MTKEIQQSTSTLKKKEIKFDLDKLMPEIEWYSKLLEHKGIQCFEVKLDKIYKEDISKMYKKLGMEEIDHAYNTIKSLNQRLINLELIDFVFISIDIDNNSKENVLPKLTGIIGFRMITDSNERLKRRLYNLIYGLTDGWICNVSELRGSADICKTLTKMFSHWNWLVKDKPKATFLSFSDITVDMHGELPLDLRDLEDISDLDYEEWRTVFLTNLHPIEPGWCLQKPVLKGKKCWVDGLNFNQISEAAKCLFYINLYLQINEIIICDKYLYVKNKNSKQTYQKLSSYSYLLNSSILIKSLVKHFPNTLTQNVLINVFNKDPKLLKNTLIKHTPLLITNKHICYNTIEFKNGIYQISEDKFLEHKHKNETKCSKYFDVNFDEIKHSAPTAWLEYLQNRVKDVNEKCMYFGQIINKKGLKNMQFNEIIKKDKTLFLTRKLINLQESAALTKKKLQIESLCKQMGISKNNFFQIKKEEAKIIVYCNKKYKLLLSKNKVKGI